MYGHLFENFKMIRSKANFTMALKDVGGAPQHHHKLTINSIGLRKRDPQDLVLPNAR